MNLCTVSFASTPSTEVLLHKSLCTSIYQNPYLKSLTVKKKLFQLFHPLSNAEIPSTNFHPKFLIFLPLNGIPKPQSEGPQTTERTVERQEIADKAVDTETPWVGQWATSNSTLWFGGGSVPYTNQDSTLLRWDNYDTTMVVEDLRATKLFQRVVLGCCTFDAVGLCMTTLHLPHHKVSSKATERINHQFSMSKPFLLWLWHNQVLSTLPPIIIGKWKKDPSNKREL